MGITPDTEFEIGQYWRSEFALDFIVYDILGEGKLKLRMVMSKVERMSLQDCIQVVDIFEDFIKLDTYVLDVDHTGWWKM